MDEQELRERLWMCGDIILQKGHDELIVYEQKLDHDGFQDLSHGVFFFRIHNTKKKVHEFIDLPSWEEFIIHYRNLCNEGWIPTDEEMTHHFPLKLQCISMASCR